jgi:uncharacterized damage-inducible protein DinB
MQLDDAVLAALRTRITGAFPQQIRASVAPLTDEQLWWRPNESSNSIANILIHLAGSVNLFLNRNHGGFEFTRDRPAEFSDRSGASKAEVLARFEEMIARAEETFAAFTADRLTAPSRTPSLHELAVEDLVNVATHFASHAGQVVWISKALLEGGFAELWEDAHRTSGAWKAKA